jgi:hypothetical protein
MTIKLMPVAQVAPQPPQLVAKPAEPKPRKRRRAAVYDADGNEVLISLMCLKCHKLRPLSLFGLRKMADGAIRNQPWCRDCRGVSQKNKAEEVAAPTPAPAPLIEPTLAAPPAPVDAAPSAPALALSSNGTLPSMDPATPPNRQTSPADGDPTPLSS